MIDILALLHCLDPYLTRTTLQQLSHIMFGIVAMTGRVTMLGISRWAGKGGSYRTVQRFFYTVIPWAMLFWLFFRRHVFNAADEYLLAGDEVVVSKAGKHTYGLGHFFSSLYGKPVPGIAFFALSLISTQERRSFPTMVEQMVRSEFDALIGIRSESNTRSLTDVPPEKQAARARANSDMMKVFMERSASGAFKWVGTLYPTDAYAQDAEMSLADFEDFVYAACFADHEDPVAIDNRSRAEAALPLVEVIGIGHSLEESRTRHLPDQFRRGLVDAHHNAAAGGPDTRPIDSRIVDAQEDPSAVNSRNAVLMRAQPHFP